MFPSFRKLEFLGLVCCGVPELGPADALVLVVGGVYAFELALFVVEVGVTKEVNIPQRTVSGVKSNQIYSIIPSPCPPDFTKDPDFGKTKTVLDGAKPNSLRGISIGFSSNNIVGNVVDRLNPPLNVILSDISADTNPYTSDNGESAENACVLAPPSGKRNCTRAIVLLAAAIRSA